MKSKILYKGYFLKVVLSWFLKNTTFIYIIYLNIVKTTLVGKRYIKMAETNLKLSQCMWCGTQNIDVLHHQFVLPICPKCLSDFKRE